MEAELERVNEHHSMNVRFHQEKLSLQQRDLAGSMEEQEEINEHINVFSKEIIELQKKSTAWE